MGSIPASEIKRRGMSAVDEDLKQGPVQVIQHNRPRYVVLSLEQFQEFQEAYEEAAARRVREALEDVAAGRARRMTARELIDELGREA